MSGPGPIDVALQRRRLIRMLVIEALCVAVALASVIGFLSFHIPWLGALFVVAVLIGFSAQIWLVLGMRGRL